MGILSGDKNICPVCGEEYEFKLRTKIVDGEKKCVHDDRQYEIRLSDHEKKIAKNLPPHKVLVKGSDGVSRICLKNNNGSR